MPLSRRYVPEWAPGESSIVGMDFSFILPVGIGITGGSLGIMTNAQPPIQAAGDFSSTDNPAQGNYFPVTVEGRTVYCQLKGGVEGTDYQLQWTVEDTAGNVWPRTALMLCSPTS